MLVGLGTVQISDENSMKCSITPQMTTQRSGICGIFHLILHAHTFTQKNEISTLKKCVFSTRWLRRRARHVTSRFPIGTDINLRRPILQQTPMVMARKARRRWWWWRRMRKTRIERMRAT